MATGQSDRGTSSTEVSSSQVTLKTHVKCILVSSITLGKQTIKRPTAFTLLLTSSLRISCLQPPESAQESRPQPPPTPILCPGRKGGLTVGAGWGATEPETPDTGSSFPERQSGSHSLSFVSAERANDEFITYNSSEIIPFPPPSDPLLNTVLWSAAAQSRGTLDALTKKVLSYTVS